MIDTPLLTPLEERQIEEDPPIDRPESPADLADSDWDFYIVVKEFQFTPDTAEPLLFENGKINTTLVTKGYFQKLLDENNIIALMCFFTPQEKYWQ